MHLLPSLAVLASLAASALSAVDRTYPFDFSADCRDPALRNETMYWTKKSFIGQQLTIPEGLHPIFWSGRVKENGEEVPVKKFAENCHHALKTTTIGQLMCNFNNITTSPMPFVMPTDKSYSTDKGKDLWDFSSEVFAKHTVGEAYVLLGDVATFTTWFSTELPTLIKNPMVTVVYGLDAACGKKCYVYCNKDNFDCDDSNFKRDYAPCVLSIQDKQKKSVSFRVQV